MSSTLATQGKRGTNLTAISTINRKECQIISRRYMSNRVQNSRFLGFCCLFSLSLSCNNRARISLTHMFALHIEFCLPLSDAKRGQAQQERLPLALRICGRLMNNMHVNFTSGCQFLHRDQVWLRFATFTATETKSSVRHIPAWYHKQPRIALPGCVLCLVGRQRLHLYPPEAHILPLCRAMDSPNSM